MSLDPRTGEVYRSCAICGRVITPDGMYRLPGTRPTLCRDCYFLYLEA